MEEKYEIIFNLKNELLQVLKKVCPTEHYEIMSQKDTLLFLRKGAFSSPFPLTDKQIARILCFFQKYKADGILFVDVTNAVRYLLDTPEENHKNDGTFYWMLRQSFTKAIVDKAKKQSEGEFI